MAAAAPTRKELLLQLGNLAAEEASHDFGPKAKERTGGLFNFNDTYKTYKKIGVPKEPDAELLHEKPFLLKVLGIAPGKDADATFKSTFLPPELTPVANKYTYPGEFKICSDDPIPYSVEVALVQEGSDTEKKWCMSSADFHAFLKGDEDKFRYTVDTNNSPIHDGLFQEKGAKTGEAIYILTREGVTDGAAKGDAVVTKSKGSKIEIQTIRDTSSTHVAYPATKLEGIETHHPTELFFSNYYISIPPVQGGTNGPMSASLIFSDGTFETHGVRYTSNDESDVRTVAGKIAGILSRVLGGAAPDQKLYHMLLQSKRAGDWLQVLACLAPERFGLAPGTRIRIVTLDILCVAYALIMGVDVLYSIKMPKEKLKYFVRFYKRTGALTPEAISKNRITMLMKSVVDPVATNIFTGAAAAGSEESYKGALTLYTSTRAAKEREYAGFFGQVCDKIGEMVRRYGELVAGNFRSALKMTFQEAALGTIDKAEGLFHLLVKSAMKLHILRETTPKLNEFSGEAEAYAKLKSFLEGQGALDKEAEKAVQVYLSQLQGLREKIKVKGDAVQKTIIDFFEKQFPRDVSLKRPLSSTNLIAAHFSIIELIHIQSKGWLSKLFDSSNSNEHGMSVFPYMNQTLTDDEKKKLLSTMDLLEKLVEPVGAECYKKILQLAKVVQPPGIVEQPPVVEVANSEILEAMFTPPAPPGAVSTVSLSDFYVEQMCLYTRAQPFFSSGESSPSPFAVEVVTRPLLQGGTPSKKGVPPYSHNPFTTFCIVLYYINATIEQGDSTLFLLSDTIEHMLSRIGAGIPIEALEVLLLEGLTPADSDIGEIMRMVKLNYYGIEEVKGAKKRMAIPQKELVECLAVRPKEMSVENRVERNQALLMNIIKHVKATEAPQGPSPKAVTPPKAATTRIVTPPRFKLGVAKPKMKTAKLKKHTLKGAPPKAKKVVNRGAELRKKRGTEIVAKRRGLGSTRKVSREVF